MLHELNPKNWRKPKGYNNAMVARGSTIYLAGQIGWDENEAFHSDEIVPQIEQALANIVTVLKSADAMPGHLVRLTWYVKNKADYLANLKPIGQVYQKYIGRHFPAMTLVEVQDLLEDRALVEIEATAVIPDK